MPFKFEGKEMSLFSQIFGYLCFCKFLVTSLHYLFFANFWSIHSKVVRLGKNAHSKQRKTISTQTLQFHVKFICMPC